MTSRADTQVLLRALAPKILVTLVRRGATFDDAEDAVQEALLSGALQWPRDGIPDNPAGWLTTVARRRLADQWRSDAARIRREGAAAALVPPADRVAPAADEDEGEDALTLLVLCCHPALSPASQVALTLRAVGGLTTAQIASAFLVPEATMAQRISRAKQRIRSTGGTFGAPSPLDDEERSTAVLQVLYLIFNEGFVTSSGPDLHRAELTQEAIRLTRQVHRLRPDDGEVAGLLALMLLDDARSPARTGPDGSLVPLAEQDRSRWKPEAVREGLTLIADTLPRTRIGPYQVQAAIAAIHAEARRAEDTDWPQIAALYELLGRISPNPMVALNHAVAVAMVQGPRVGLDLLAPLDADHRLSGHHRLAAVRGHLLELADDAPEALRAYRTAARLTASLPERRYLEARAARLAGAPTAHRREPPYEASAPDARARLEEAT